MDAAGAQIRLTSLDAAVALAEGPYGPAMIHRQTAAIIDAGGGGVRPLHHGVAFNLMALAALVQAQDALADPFLLRHLVGRLDAAMLSFVRGHVRQPRQAMHFPLSLAGVQGEDIARIAGGSVHRLGVELALEEAAADPAGYAAARSRLARLGVQVVLGQVTAPALLLTRPGSLGADLLKLVWSPALAREVDRALIAAVTGLGADTGMARIVLAGADSEAALRWGLALGIRRFQGRHVDAMLAAGRILACPIRPPCTLAQCTERAAATLPAGRLGCGNPLLLEAAA